MSDESTNEEVVEAPAETKPKITPTLILALLAGALLAVMIGGTVYHFQSGKALRAELAAAKEEARRQTLKLAETQAQIAGLSRQLHALREFSLSKADAVAEKQPPAATPETAKNEPVATAPPASAPTATAKKEPLVATAPAAKKSKPANLDCQLAGKSAEEQTATLKRCTEAMDGRK